MARVRFFYQGEEITRERACELSRTREAYGKFANLTTVPPRLGSGPGPWMEYVPNPPKADK